MPYPGRRGVAALRSGDIGHRASLTVEEHERIHAALERVGRCQTVESFADAACRELLALVPGLNSAYLEMNLLEGLSAARQWPDPGAEWYARFGPLVHRLQHHYPHYRRLAEGDLHQSVSWTFPDDDPFVRTELFQEFFVPNGVRSQLAFSLPAPPTTSIAVTVNRDGTSFSDREHQVADVMRVHLANLRQLVARTGTPPPLSGWACLTVSGGGSVLRTTPEAVEIGRQLGLDLRVGASLADHDLWPRLGLSARSTRWRVGTEVLSAQLRSHATLTVRAVATAVGPHLVWLHAPTLLRPEVAEALGLTARQREVAQLLVDGADTAEIAERLYISPATVRKHVEQILGTLGVSSRLEAVVTLIRASQ